MVKRIETFFLSVGVNDEKCAHFYDPNGRFTCSNLNFVQMFRANMFVWHCKMNKKACMNAGN